MTGMVGVDVGGGSVGGRVASLTLVFAGKEGWARSASRLDLKPVKATYSPNANTNKTIRNPNAYPLFIEPAMPLCVLSSGPPNEPSNYTPKASKQQAGPLLRAGLLQSRHRERSEAIPTCAQEIASAQKARLAMTGSSWLRP
jgi:hypothetical protein